MPRITAVSLAVLAFLGVFWAYDIASTLVRDMGKDVTYVDLGAIFVLGMISGFALGFLVVARRQAPPPAG